MATDKINSSQRPFRIKKSLRDLLHKPHHLKAKRYSLQLPSLPQHDTKTDEYVYDILYECQRGSLTLGYSSKTLLQFDPNPWCDVDMRFTPMNIENYQLPDPTWEWVNKEWMVDMTEDVDEAGWQYALKFHGATWHGNYKNFRSFVRRRRWIRLRHRLINHDTQPQLDSPLISPIQSSATIGKHQDILEKLSKCRLDRERVEILSLAIESTLPGFEDSLLRNAHDYMAMLDYEETKVQFVEQLFKRRHDQYKGSKPVQLTDDEKEVIKSLHFYHDVQRILSQMTP